MRIADVIFSGVFKDILLQYFLSKPSNCEMTAIKTYINDVNLKKYITVTIFNIPTFVVKFITIYIKSLLYEDSTIVTLGSAHLLMVFKRAIF